jgi:polyisoprenoid-binding protein YceI
VPIHGTHTLGPHNSSLSLRTGRTGAASKAGHDLLLDVTSWQATLEVGENPTQAGIALHADAASLRVREGTGGMQSLGDDDKASIQQTIDEEVLKGTDIEFHSTEVRTDADGRMFHVRGELKLFGNARPITFELHVSDNDKLSASTVLKQTDWGMKPYSTLFGALKVADEVEVVLETAPL